VVEVEVVEVLNLAATQAHHRQEIAHQSTLLQGNHGIGIKM
jgi:hypothetical protein